MSKLRSTSAGFSMSKSNTVAPTKSTGGAANWGKTFTDEYGRKYTQTQYGRIMS